MTRYLLLVSLLALTACNSTIPSSALLNLVRGERQRTIAIEMRQHDFKLGQPVFVRIFKEEGLLETWLADEHTGKFTRYKTYPICKFSGGLGPKLAEGDKQAPEGFYLIGSKQLNPNSAFHLAMNLGYPNAYDRQLGRTGSALMIHGGCASTGCFAMTNPAIEEVYLMVDNAMRHGQEYVNVHIYPFRMTDENMARHANSEWRPFWQNLKDGYDAFERTHIPPLVGVDTGRYVFYDRQIIQHNAALQIADGKQDPATALASAQPGTTKQDETKIAEASAEITPAAGEPAKKKTGFAGLKGLF